MSNRKTEYRVVRRSSLDSANRLVRRNAEQYPHYYTVEQREYWTEKKWWLFGPLEPWQSEWEVVDWEYSELAALDRARRERTKGVTEVIWESGK